MNGERLGDAGLLPDPDDYTPVSRRTRVLATPLSPYAPPSPDQIPDESVGPPAASEASTALYDGEREIQDDTSPEHNRTSDGSDHRDEFNDDDATDDLTDEELAALVIGSQLADLSVKVIDYDAVRKREKAVAFNAAARTIGTQLTQLHTRTVQVAEAKRKEKADADSRRTNITENLIDIVEAVDRELHFARVLDAKDHKLGMSSLLGIAVVEYAIGRDIDRVNHPGSIADYEVKVIEDDGKYEVMSITEWVVENSSGTKAGVSFLRTLVEEGFLSSEMISRISNMLPQVTKRERKNGITPLDLIDDVQAWNILKTAFVEQNRAYSLDVHRIFFPAVHFVDEQLPTILLDDAAESDAVKVRDEVWLEHDMCQDFHDVAIVLDFIERRDFEDASPGSLHVGYIIRPLHKRPENGPDAIDKIKKLAGKNIASVGQNSFVALVNANTRPDLVGISEAHSGAYMILGYEPRMPAYDDEARADLEADGINIRVVQDGSEDEADDNIYWKARVWRLSNTAYSVIRDILDNRMEDPDSPYQSFINPGETLAESFASQEVTFVRRANAVAEVERVIRRFNRMGEQAKEDLSLGQQPSVDMNFEMPQLGLAGSFRVSEMLASGKMDELFQILGEQKDLDPRITEIINEIGIVLPKPVVARPHIGQPIEARSVVNDHSPASPPQLVTGE